MTFYKVSDNPEVRQPLLNIKSSPDSPPTQKEIKEQVSDFADHLLVYKGFAMGTIGIYCSMASKVLHDTGTREPTHRQIEKHIIGMYKAKKSGSYINNVGLAIEAYMDFIKDPIKLGRPRKAQGIVKETLTEPEIAVILASAKNIREKAMLAILAYSGIRNQELCNLKVSDIDARRNQIRVIEGKGKKSRLAHIKPECTQVIEAYLAAFPRKQDDRLFTTLRRGIQYTPWAVRRMVKVVASRTPIQKRVYPHLFRHSLAVNMIDRGASIFAVKEQLGHNFIETTMIYAHIRPARVRDEYGLFAPSYL